MQVAILLEDLARDIMNVTTCRNLYIGELLFRYKGKYLKSTQEADMYNAQVHAANCELKAYFANNACVTWWSCKGMKGNMADVMHSDGTHLSDKAGMFKYYKALRGVVVHAMNLTTAIKYVVIK